MTRIAFYLAAWLTALSVFFWPQMPFILFVWLFPMGLFGLATTKGSGGYLVDHTSGLLMLLGGYVVYTIHGWFYFRCNNNKITTLLFLALISMLILNVAGCEHMNTHNK